MSTSISIHHVTGIIVDEDDPRWTTYRFITESDEVEVVVFPVPDAPILTDGNYD